MKRWKSKLASAALLAAVGGTGCRQQLYMHEQDAVLSQNWLPKDLETNPNLSVGASPRQNVVPPPTVLDPDQPPRYMTLQEALMIGLEQGNRGSASAANLTSLGGGASRQLVDDLNTFTGNAVSGDDSMRTFGLDPATVGAGIEGALAKFDTRWVSSINWAKTDTPSGNIFAGSQNGDTATGSTGLIKPLPTGGVVGLTFQTDYTKLSNQTVAQSQGTVNPNYRPSLGITIDQPLLRDYGVDINQLLAAHPSTSVVPNYSPTGGRSEGILVTRIRFEQQKLSFEGTVNFMLLNVETAYWNLYSAYFALYANDQGLRQSFETWRLTKVLVDAGTKPQQDLDQVRSRFEQFRASRLASIQGVLEAERQLRGLLNLPVVDGTRLVPADEPTQAPYSPDYASAVNDMLQNRPELALTRQDLKARQLDILVQKNGLRPDLRVSGSYNVNALGSRFDGSGTVNGAPSNALAQLSDNKFNSYNLGLRLDVPIGFRDAHSSLRVSQLNLARTYITLKNQELKGERFLQAVWQQIFNQYEQIRAYRAQREALGSQLELLFSRVELGKDPLLNILDAQRDFASAIQSEFQAVANYNVAIAGFQYAKGTLMNYDNVKIAQGPLPGDGLIPLSGMKGKHKGRFDRTAPVPTVTEIVPQTPTVVPGTLQPVPSLENAPPLTPTPKPTPTPAQKPAPVASAVPPTISAVPPATPSVPAPLDAGYAPAPGIASDSNRPVITVTTLPADTSLVPPANSVLPAAPVVNALPTGLQK